MDTVDPKDYSNRTQSRTPSGDPRRFGYPDSWLRAPRERAEQVEILDQILAEQRRTADLMEQLVEMVERRRQ